MIEYLTNHDRYYTLNSWNNNTTYSRCVKISHLDFSDEETRHRAYEFLDVDEAFEEGHHILREFDERHHFFWHIASNGRSSGYLILLKSGVSDFGDHNISAESVDAFPNFELWAFYYLKERVDVVWDFDRTVEAACQAFIRFVKTHDVSEEVVMIPKVLRVAVPIG
jgi:hypothetical protein